jgi:hypothetical protein
MVELYTPHRLAIHEDFHLKETKRDNFGSLLSHRPMGTDFIRGEMEHFLKKWSLSTPLRFVVAHDGAYLSRRKRTRLATGCYQLVFHSLN